MVWSPKRLFVLKLTIFFLSLLPAAQLVYAFFMQKLGANPVETLSHTTGDWALYFLLLTLAITPLRKFTGRHALVRFRRMLALFAFFYALIHFSIWLVLDHEFVWGAIIKDIIKRPYITFGFLSFILMAPLAITSTNGWMRRLGAQWKRLHRLVYIIAILAILHFIWLVKADFLDPLVYGILLSLLLVLRLPVTERLLSARKV
ncbi:MAG: sulfoxide reductase heme-binding subunit YedZ [Gammaproteobacteria bacterium]|nr:sulfoxide reductase heme-binding subunit YedZ [Gammaproteobacteria bacterium]